MDLRQKVQFILNNYNKGESIGYSENMVDAIHRAELGNQEYSINEDNVTRQNQRLSILLIWSLSELLGECILMNNPDFFKDLKT